jgi:N-acetyl-gamma-glutamyl-phosphate reductase
VRLVQVTSRSSAGRPLAEAYPGLDTDLVLRDGTDPGDAEVVFAALPHGLAGELAAGWRAEGRTVIDLGADYRLKDADEYARWYGMKHPAPTLLREAVFGLPELYREQLLGAKLVACPGCYSTAAILALYPGLRSGLLDSDVIVSAASGISGAGRSLGLGTHFSEVNEDYRAYSVTGHRHVAEMRQELSIDGSVPRLTFVPHLAPMVRGILASCYAGLHSGASLESLIAAYRDFYAGAPFVRVVDEPPRTKAVAGTNECHVHISAQDGKVIILAALDNLLKGASGQAVQAFNIVSGWDEATGLDAAPRWP